MSLTNCRGWIWIVALLGVMPLGCGGESGPPLGQVTGTVTLDGQPLVGAHVYFSPVAGGRSSEGVTDSSGSYSLEYTFDKLGALLGEHEVRIHSAEFAGEAAKDPVVPAKYNSSTELIVTVGKGGNTLDFQLAK